MQNCRKPPRDVSFDPTVATNLGPPINMAGADFRIVNITDDYCTILQRSREELINTEWRDLLHPDDAADQTDKQAILLATGQPYEVSSRTRRGDGLWIRGYCRASLVQNSGGRPPLIQCNARFEPVVTPPSLVPWQPTGPTATTEYIQFIATELAKIAGQERLTMLQHLLSMVSVEAAEELQRRIFNIGPDSFSKAIN